MLLALPGTSSALRPVVAESAQQGREARLDGSGARRRPEPVLRGPFRRLRLLARLLSPLSYLRARLGPIHFPGRRAPRRPYPRAHARRRPAPRRRDGGGGGDEDEKEAQGIHGAWIFEGMRRWARNRPWALGRGGGPRRALTESAE
mmetsp:Transcript_1592/g.5171  ORF Transcript_1592/g.5171 Transcript_1592/m.5171 type:complete len:146 (+) Transcript_1592:146-583(+)